MNRLICVSVSDYESLWTSLLSFLVSGIILQIQKYLNFDSPHFYSQFSLKQHFWIALFLLSIFSKLTFLTNLNFIILLKWQCLIFVAILFEIHLSGSTHLCCLFLKRKFYEKISFCCHKNLVSGLLFGHFRNRNSSAVSFLLSFS